MVVEQSDDRGILDPEESHPLPRGRGLAMERQLGLTARAAGRAHDREIDVGRGSRSRANSSWASIATWTPFSGTSRPTATK